MTVVCVLADPPRAGLVCPDLAATTPLSPDEVVDLYAASFEDVCTAVAKSGGDLLVNYRPEDALPESHRTGDDVEAALRALVADALGGTDDVRFEPQVGETYAGRVGNTVTHLLDGEEVASAAAVPPTAALLTRTVVDNAAMKLRRNPVVLGPTPDGDVSYAGFAETVDFADAYAPPAVETLTDHGRDAGHDVDFLPLLPRVDSPSGLRTTVTTVRARRRAGRSVPEHVTALVESLGLQVVVEDETPTLVRG